MRFVLIFYVCGILAGGEAAPKPTQAEQDEIWRRAMEESARAKLPAAAPPAAKPIAPAAPAIAAGLPSPLPKAETAWMKAGDGEYRVTSWAVEKVRLESISGNATSADVLAVFNIEVRNPDEKKILRYNTWRADLMKFDNTKSAALTDDIGNIYKRVQFGLGSRPAGTAEEMQVSIYPGRTICDVLVFGSPVLMAKTLILELPNAALGGGAGSMKLIFPIKKP